MTPIKMGLVTACPMAIRDNPALSGAATPPTLMVQLDTQGGQIYLAELSVLAAKQLLLMLSNWQPVLNSLSEPGWPAPPKSH